MKILNLKKLHELEFNEFEFINFVLAWLPGVPSLQLTQLRYRIRDVNDAHTRGIAVITAESFV